VTISTPRRDGYETDLGELVAAARLGRSRRPKPSDSRPARSGGDVDGWHGPIPTRHRDRIDGH
jgi:hypothetical protein